MSGWHKVKNRIVAFLREPGVPMAFSPRALTMAGMCSIPTLEYVLLPFIKGGLVEHLPDTTYRATPAFFVEGPATPGQCLEDRTAILNLFLRAGVPIAISPATIVRECCLTDSRYEHAVDALLRDGLLFENGNKQIKPTDKLDFSGTVTAARARRDRIEADRKAINDRRTEALRLIEAARTARKEDKMTRLVEFVSHLPPVPVPINRKAAAQAIECSEQNVANLLCQLVNYGRLFRQGLGIYTTTREPCQELKAAIDKLQAEKLQKAEDARVRAQVAYLERKAAREAKAPKIPPAIVVLPMDPALPPSQPVRTLRSAVVSKGRPQSPTVGPTDPWARIRARHYGRPAMPAGPSLVRQLTPEEMMVGKAR